MTLKAEFYDDSVRRITELEPEDFKKLLEVMLPDKLPYIDPFYKRGTWGWYASALSETGHPMDYRHMIKKAGWEWVSPPWWPQ